MKNCPPPARNLSPLLFPTSQAKRKVPYSYPGGFARSDKDSECPCLLRLAHSCTRSFTRASLGRWRPRHVGSSVVLSSPTYSLTCGSSREPWTVASSTSTRFQVLLLDPPDRQHPYNHHGLRGSRRKGHGHHSRARRWHGHLQTRRQGRRAKARQAQEQLSLTSQNVRIHHQPGAGPDPLPAIRAGHHGGDGSDQRLLEAVLLSDGRPVAGDAAQREANTEHPGQEIRRE